MLRYNIKYLKIIDDLCPLRKNKKGGFIADESIARVCHEANRAYCSTIGDDSQLSWDDDAPQWQKDSAINGVQYHRENPEAKPSHSHECWLKEKEQAGWVYGPIKDPEKKEHPCMVPYAELPKSQQVKDSLFLSIARTLI